MLICLPTSLLCAQNSFDAGLYYGNSNVLRSDAESYYNYENQEVGVFFGKTYPVFQRSEKRSWELDWRFHYILADYKLTALQHHQTVHKSNVIFGVGYAWYQPKIQYKIRFGIGPGLHTGYLQRLTAGYFFTEELSVTVRKKIMEKQHLALTFGGMHNSNGNIYHINRGLDLLFARVGFTW